MDEDSGSPTGPPEPVSLPSAVSGNFSVSQQGEVAFTTVTRSYRLLSFPLDASSGVAGPPQPLFGGSQEILTYEPSPDGKSMAFTTTGSTQEDVYVANVDGSRVRQLTNDAARDRGVTWSSDGKTLYFYSNRQGAYHLWSIRADGADLTRITTEADLRSVNARNIYAPVLAPGGRTILAQTDDMNVFVHLDRPAGRRVELLDSRFIAGGVWSADGRQIVGRYRETVNAPTRTWGLAVYTPATREVKKIHDQGVGPAWLSDGRIAFFEAGSIGIADPATNRIERVPLSIAGVALHNSSVPPRLSRDGKIVYVRQALELGDVWMIRFNEGRLSPGP
jgi:dipeptidyl aminopeptidase/acylaminoacyl peptidase